MKCSIQPQSNRASGRRARSARAFSLLELLTAVAIIAVLASAAVLIASGLRKRAERIQCGENLKALHMALNAYLVDFKHWPQVGDTDDEELYWQAWASKLDKYDLPDKVWMCPTHLRATKDEFLRYSSYHPMPFDAKSIMTPRRWKNMPWVIEIGDNHGKGPLMIMEDGSIQIAPNIEKPFSNIDQR